MHKKFLGLDEYTGNILATCLPEEDTLFKLACLFGVFSDCTRLKIVYALAISDMCVTDLAVALEINQSTLSHQLKTLRGIGIIKGVRHGKSMIYSAKADFVNDLIISGVDFLKGE